MSNEEYKSLIIELIQKINNEEDLVIVELYLRKLVKRRAGGD